MKNIDLKNTIISDIIQLFAAMASADGKVTSEEKEFIHNYFNSLYPVTFAQVLFEEFEKAIKSGTDRDTLLSGIHKRLSFDDKIFLVVKLIELMVIDEIDDSEKKVLNIIAEKLVVPKDTVDFLISLISGYDNEEIKTKIRSYNFLTISDIQDISDVLLPFPGLKLTVVNIGKSLIIVQKDVINNVLINDKPLIKKFTTRIPKNGHIRINDQYEISYQDLRYYFKNKESSKSVFYLSETNKDIESGMIPSEADMLICEREKCMIYLTPLKDNKLLINGHKTNIRTPVNLNDKIFWDNYKINLRTLVFQSFFQISEKTSLSPANIRKFTIGNNLESTIIIEDEFDKLWNCQVELIDKSYYIEVEQCPYHVYINEKKATKKTRININDKIRIRNTIISYNPSKRVFEKKVFGINSFDAQGIKYQFNDKTYGVDNVSFTSKRGELVGIIGSSGCGKSTLLNILNGFYKPQEGSVVADGCDIHKNVNLLSSYMSYVPQFDLLFENLTVYENLYYNAKLRFPGAKRNIETIVNRVLHEIGLYEKRNVIVGDTLNKTLSGGERKRINIGLELLADSNIILLDEPTSGLSSKDSERILRILQNLTFQGKIIYVVIHQPSAKLFELFNKLILLDKGGKLAYFGSPFAAIDYFRRYSEKPKNSEHEHTYIDPDFLLDTIEQQISDIDGTPLPIRKFSPGFWQEEFIKHQSEILKNEKRKKSDSILIRPSKTIKDHLSISKTLLQRNFVNKLRDKSNLIITFLLPPILGLFVGAILHYSPGNDYTFFENKHIGTFLFLSMLIAVFLGITNSVEEIIKDQNVLYREKMLKISKLSYFNSKMLTLLPFAVIQNLLFVYVGYSILEGKEFYLVYTVLLSVISFCGISVGLFISSIPKLTSKAAVNIIPVILIPQIVFGGALIQYQEMNKQLVVNVNSPIPEICQLMPSRWGFESLVTYLGYNNSYRAVENLEEEMETINREIKNSENEEELNRLLETRADLRVKIDEFKLQYHDTHGNMDISQAIKIDGNLEYKNFIEGKTTVYPMFIGKKKLPVFNQELSTPLYNSIVLIFMSLIVNFLTLMILKVRFK
jgi:ABC-type multidrug transport system ATPase subunit/uncharacterized tellurite resistance protein B-like protein